MSAYRDRQRHREQRAQPGSNQPARHRPDSVHRARCRFDRLCGQQHRHGRGRCGRGESSLCGHLPMLVVRSRPHRGAARPAGTLFGRNTRAGVVSITTAAPWQTFGAGVDAEYGRFNAARVRGFITDKAHAGSITPASMPMLDRVVEHVAALASAAGSRARLSPGSWSRCALANTTRVTKRCAVGASR